MIKLTGIDGKPVLVNILVAPTAVRNGSATFIGGVYVTETLEEILEESTCACIRLLHTITAVVNASS
jgi:hypothetical protein